jgi:hypothetical protein
MIARDFADCVKRRDLVRHAKTVARDAAILSARLLFGYGVLLALYLYR